MEQRYLSDSNFLAVIEGEILGFSKIETMVMKKNVKIFNVVGARELEKKEPVMVHTLKLEKAVSEEENETIKKLVPGCKLDGFMIIILNRQKKAIKSFAIEQGVVSSRSYSNLDAASGKPLMMTLEILYYDMKEV